MNSTKSKKDLFQLKEQGESSMLQMLPLENGILKEKSKHLDLEEKEHIENIMSKNSLPIDCVQKNKKKTLNNKKQSKEKKSSILESQPEINQTISKDSQNSSKKNTLTTNLLKILDQGLTIKEKDSKPF